jgi:ABC-type nitrate/sulfonate/bicarbonate transport system substrate-binding protein
MRKRAGLLCVSAFAIAILAAMAFAQQPPAQAKYTVSLPVIAGMETSSVGKLMIDVVNAIAKKLNLKIDVVKRPYWYDADVPKIVANDFKSKKVDVSFLSGVDYANYLRSGHKDATPIFQLSMSKKTVYNGCLYARKGEAKSLADLRGKKLGTAYVRPVRLIMFKNGVNEPIEKFFGGVSFIPDAPPTAMVDALEKKKIDAFYVIETSIFVAGYTAKKNLTWGPVACTEYDASPIFIARKDVDPNMVQKLQATVINSVKDPAFAQFQFAFKMVDGRFLPFDEKGFQKIAAVNDLVVKNGWDKEEKAFLKKYMKK